MTTKIGTKTTMDPAAQVEATRFLEADEPLPNLDREEHPLTEAKDRHQDRYDVNPDAAPSEPLLPLISSSRRPKCMIIIPPPSNAKLRRRSDRARDHYGLIPGKNMDMMGNTWDDDPAAEFESPGYYDIVREDELGVRTVERKLFSERSPKRNTEFDIELDTIWERDVARFHPGKARLGQLYGQFPKIGSPLPLANENDGRRQFLMSDEDIKDERRSTSSFKSQQPSIQLDAENTTMTKGSAEWLDDWNKGKAEVQERLRVLYETGNRRTSYCTRIA